MSGGKKQEAKYLHMDYAVCASDLRAYVKYDLSAPDVAARLSSHALVLLLQQRVVVGVRRHQAPEAHLVALWEDVHAMTMYYSNGERAAAPEEEERGWFLSPAPVPHDDQLDGYGKKQKQLQ